MPAVPADPVVPKSRPNRRRPAPATPKAPHLLDHGPFVTGFLLAAGALAAFFLAGLIVGIGHTLVLIVLALFLAAGLNPAVEFIERKGLPRTGALLIVIASVLAAVALFFVALVPVISEQVALLVGNVPDWIAQLGQSPRMEEMNAKYGVLDKAEEIVASGDWISGLFGGVLGFGLAILGGLANTFVVVVLTLYFLASLEKTKKALYDLAPASKRARVTGLAEAMLDGVGGYVSGAFIVAFCAGVSSLAFLFIVGLGQYAIALALVVAVLDVIPMIGAMIGATLVTAIGFATDVNIGVACLIFFVVYQQVENYLIYPRVMKRSVDVPGAVTVVAALIGASMLGVVGAMMAVPVAAAVLMLVREVWTPRADAR